MARALDIVRRLVFANRVELLKAFEAADAKGAGLISPESWAQAMSKITGTPSDFPWLELMQFLTRLQEDWVPYMEFLLRYDNPLARELAERWCTAMIKEI